MPGSSTIVVARARRRRSRRAPASGVATHMTPPAGAARRPAARRAHGRRQRAGSGPGRAPSAARLPCAGADDDRVMAGGALFHIGRQRARRHAQLSTPGRRLPPLPRPAPAARRQPQRAWNPPCAPIGLLDPVAVDQVVHRRPADAEQLGGLDDIAVRRASAFTMALYSASSRTWRRFSGSSGWSPPARPRSSAAIRRRRP